MMRYELTATILLVALSTSIGCNRGKDDQSETKKQADPAVVTRTAEGDPLVRIGQEAQARIGLEIATVSSESLQPQLVAYGRLEEDPSRSFVVRSPVAGTLQVPKGTSWPSVGEIVAAGQDLGLIEPRIAPAERISITTQLASARSEVDSAVAAEETARAAYERARVLNADNKNVSDRVVEEARSRLEAERARLRSARTTVGILENSLRASGPAASRLIVDVGGTVVETMARPGESVEAGLPLLRVSGLDHLVARVDLPVGQNLPASAKVARIVPAGHEREIVQADRIAATPVIDPKSPGESFLFRLRGGRFGFRPGLAVTAYLPLPGASRQGFKVPAAAVVRLSGKAYVYVQSAPDRFVRREVRVESPVDSGYFVTGRLAAGDRIVVTGAQTLLSEEFKPESVQEE
jgi:RND family efflux transporter MFP subunit